MIVHEIPDSVKGKTFVCRIDNQIVKAVLERKGTSHNLELNEIGKSIYGSMYLDLTRIQENLQGWKHV